MARRPREPKFRNANLLKRFDKVNLQHFAGIVCGGIGWRHFSVTDTTTLGLCVFEERFIKINTVLDDSRIPLWYLDFVIHHEMLHLHLGPRQFDSDSYAYPHDLRFQCIERRHPDYERALRFEKDKIEKILVSHRKWREWEKEKARKLRQAAKRRSKKL